MVAPLVAAAGITAVGSALGAATGGKGAKQAARIQQQTSREQIASVERNRDMLLGLSQPTIDRGNRAGETYAGMLGLGDAESARASLDTWRGSTGYQDLIREGMKSVNTNAYARGMGESGATYKALQDRGTQIANQSGQQFLGNLSGLMEMGSRAVGTVGGVATNATNAINASRQDSADAFSNAALASSAHTSRGIDNLINFGAYAAGRGTSSSYGTPQPVSMRGGLPGRFN